MLANHTPLLVVADASAVVVAFASLIMLGGGVFAALSSFLSCVWLGLRLYQDPAIKPTADWVLTKLRLK